MDQAYFGLEADGCFLVLTVLGLLIAEVVVLRLTLDWLAATAA